jgi:mannose-1-phosphate guanylyltransferase
MFVWTAEAILSAVEQYRSEMGRQLKEYAKSVGTPDEMEARGKLYAEAESISIDYAVLEKATNVLAVKADIVWDDVGSWLALQRYKHVDGDNNVVVGEALVQEAYETTIYNNSDGIIAALGVSDLVIVRSDDITFVAHKAKLGEMKKLLKALADDDENRKYL